MAPDPGVALITRIYTSPYPAAEIPSTTITEEVFRHAARLRDRVAVVDGATGETHTYGQLQDSVTRLAGGLRRRGYGKGDVVAIIAPNLAEYVTVFHAVATIGGIVTTLNPSYTTNEIEAQLRDSGARLVVTIPALIESTMAAVGDLAIEDVVVIGEAEPGILTIDDLLDDVPWLAEAGIDPAEDVVVLPYSSGTTGLPKGVQLTHRNLVANLAQYGAISEAGDRDVVLAVLPFFHIYGMQILMNGVLHVGGTIVTMPRFDLERFLALIEEHRVTRVAVVPPIVLAMAKSPLVDQYDLGSLVQIGSGAAPMGAGIEDEAARRVGAPVVQGYGLTETSPVTHAMPPDRNRRGSVGVPVPNTEVRVVAADTGEDLGIGESGEIWIRGPQVMKGYLNDPGATMATLDEEGWLHTGDIGHVDDDGYFYITDRMKELIKYKGFQVAPAELEAILVTHPAVLDAAVVGVEDDEAGEAPKAFVVLVAGAEASPDEIMAYVAGLVAGFKRVRQVEFVDAIPKSASGKILRRLLR